MQKYFFNKTIFFILTSKLCFLTIFSTFYLSPHLFMNNIADIKFPKNSNHSDFIHTLRSRVNAYFISNRLSKYGDASMVFKTVVMCTIYFLPYFLMLTGWISQPLTVLLAWLVMGVGMAGLGLAVMHDANHGSYSENKTVSKYVGYIIFMISGNRENWLMQHNRLHHTFTNVEGYDMDIETPSLLRFSPQKPRTAIHQYQHIFAWFLYSLLTVSWMTEKDFGQLYIFRKMGLINSQAHFRKLMRELIISKLIYYVFIIVLPIVFIAVPFWLVLIGILLMHMVAGLILSCIFQLAHIMPSSDFPVQNEQNGDLENNWAVHQLATTCNFAPSNSLLSWYAGGLNFQIEHHLFPQICHIHYKNIAQIVQQTANDYGLPYYSEKSFWGAVGSHIKMLKQLGTVD